MSTNMAETIKIVSDAGNLGVLVLVLVGLGYLALRAVPAMTAFFVALTGKQAEQSAKQAVTDTKVDALIASMAALNAAVAELGRISQAAIARAGDTVSSSLARIGDVVQEEARETRDAAALAERRITAVIRREQVSEPPAPASRPSLSTPATGLSRVPRVGNG